MPSPLVKPSCGFRACGFPTASLPAHGDDQGQLRRSSTDSRKSSDPCGVVRLFANHRSSTSSKARLKQGSFPPPPLHGFTSTMTLSNSRRVRIAASMEPKLPPNGSPTLPASPLRRAMPTTPADRMEAVDTFCHPYCLPQSLAGRHPQLHFRGLLRLHSRYGPPHRSTAQGGLCHEASTPPVFRRRRSSASGLRLLSSTLLHR